MGIIRPEVRNKHLKDFPQHEELLTPFLKSFFVTRGAKRQFFRKQSKTELFEFFLSPEENTKEKFGFNLELLLIYSPHNEMAARTIQAVEEVYEGYPAKGRVETLVYILISESTDVHKWLKNYSSSQRSREPRIIIAFSASELRQNARISNYINNKISEQFYQRDLFDFSLPLKEDAYFFGRERLLTTYYDAVKKSENRGLFGLRKTGKTSFLYKLKRTVEFEKKGVILFFDCKNPSIKKLRWNEFLGEICNTISDRTGIKIAAKSKKYTEKKIATTFSNLIKKVAELEDNNRVALIFDEIEYISFLNEKEEHWIDDYIDFWQTIWSCQSEHRNLVFFIAGLNPNVLDTNRVKGVQNPLFGIVSPDYLTGFTKSEMKLMVSSLGKKIGLDFTDTALNYLYTQYGGHPHLTRKSCSWINKDYTDQAIHKPITISDNDLIKSQERRDLDLSYYSGHVVAELSDFYPDEYTMLEMLSSGEIRDFIEFSTEPEFTKHLMGYGLLKYDSHNMPKITIPVVEKHIGLELAKKEGRKTILRVITPDQRELWLPKRIDYIIKDFQLLVDLIDNAGQPSLFGKFSFPESSKFSRVEVCDTELKFENFINTCFQCFVESIEVYGKPDKKYYRDTITPQYPSLVHALERIRVYRHNYHHLKLSMPITKDKLVDYLKADLESQKPSQVKDLHFVLQQCVLDNLLAGLQVEINRLT
ncbi:ATP-binding protein [Microscilla marina]|uniref:Uncharacterized protein n=1 Tax=Microscilla marina ATCC 23134 TaxID=313606 RepID=A1ZK03_MICM2|nr:hypothetical protein [Microscilla marina]EAY29456.1 hypothetical protein M23134_01516 [Microscilla marina ATCC 23134]